MLSYKKPFTEKEINYFCYLQDNFYNGYLIAEDMLLSSIDADLPTSEELFKQRIKYNEMNKHIEAKMKKEFEKTDDRYFLIDVDGSVGEWDRDTYNHFKDAKGFNYVP